MRRTVPFSLIRIPVELFSGRAGNHLQPTQTAVRHQYGPWHGMKEFLISGAMSGRSNAKMTPNNEILSWLRQREDEMATLLEELVAIPTENPPGANYRGCIDLLENSL